MAVTLNCGPKNVYFMMQRIHATIKKPQIGLFQNILKEGGLYAVKDFMVAESNPRYKTTPCIYKIIFVQRTRVVEIFDISFPYTMFEFKSFDQLIDAQTVDESTLIDIIGRLACKYSSQHKEIQGRQSKLMDIILEDLQGLRLPCTLWGDYVDELTDYLSIVNDEQPVIVLLQMCRAKKFGVVRVENTFYVTKR
ncbi:replication protein A 70 kDa DNA-binding subunit [Striga asiatica]|uniref:Replication protein A 70 kDa DNA-binding subunit n=1 Tax=Striga asiatica TaxID=4170 RepID=A0A5A7RGU5_STRAF|nr:replication protein A 70 kDa DNA-binding subunit [Striga asiatica]